MLVQLAPSGDLDVKRQATWGMSVGKAGCFGIDEAPCRDAQAYKIRTKVRGSSNVPRKSWLT